MHSVRLSLVAPALLLCACKQLGPHRAADVTSTASADAGAASPSATPRSAVAPSPANTPVPTPAGVVIDGSYVPFNAAAPVLPIATPTPAPTNAAVDDLSFIDADYGWAVGEVCPRRPLSCQPALWQTADGGQTWRNTGTAPSPPVPTLPFQPGAAERLLFVSRQYGWIYGWRYGPQIYATRDGGATWLAQALPASVYSITYADGVLWAVLGQPCSAAALVDICQPQIIQSANLGRSWDPFNNPLNPLSTLPKLLRLDGGRAWLFGDHLERTTDGGLHWTRRPLPSDCHRPNYFGPAAVSFAGGVLWLMCVGQASNGAQGRAIYTSTDAGDSWTEAFPPPSLSGLPLTADGYAHAMMAVTSRVALLCLTRGGPLQMTQNGGQSWRSLSMGGDVPCTALLFIDVLHGWMAEAGGVIWRTEDGGAHWQRVGLP